MKHLLNINDSNHQIKFKLFVQARKIKQIAQALNQTLVNEQKQEREWLVQHQELIDSLLSDLLDDSMLVFDGVQLDDEGIDLSLDLMYDINLALDLMQEVIYQEEIESN